MPYNPESAVEYAHRWAHDRNPNFYDFTNLGGDCTNFISQCLYAGCGKMVFLQNGWYYRNQSDRSPAWSAVELLYQFLTRKPAAQASASPIHGTNIPLGDAVPGDIIQLSFDGKLYTHSLLVVESGADGVLVATHSYDADYRPLSSYTFENLRALHIT